MMEKPIIGVYTCGCGLSISDVVDIEEVKEYAGTFPGVLSKKHVCLCSKAGQSMIKDDIKDHRLNRVIIAGCSPLLFEATFRSVVEEGGLNPYLLEMVNLREQCSWVHLNQPREATEKAKALVRMAIARASLLQPLERRKYGIEAKALVIGGGVAGLRSALDLADRGFPVNLVENSPYLGGRASQLNRITLTNEEALKSINPMLRAVMKHPKIEILTNSEVEDVDGYTGKFEVSITKKPRYVNDKCTACGKCSEVCPIDVPDEFNLGLSNRKAIYIPYKDAVPNIFTIDEANCTKCGECLKVCEEDAINLDAKAEEAKVSAGTIIVASGFDPYMPSTEYGSGQYKDVVTQLQLERILSKNGPTGGRLLRLSTEEKPKNIVFILCVGSRDTDRPYCSKICCATALKNAMLIKEQYPDTETFVLYRDIRLFGKDYEEYYTQAREVGVIFLEFLPDKPLKVFEDPETKHLRVLLDEPTLGTTVEIPADLIVLAEGMVPREDASKLGSMFGLPVSPISFFKVAHPKLQPFNTTVEGIYLAGAVQGPKEMTESLVQASAAASKAAILLSKGEIEMDPIVAIVDEELCGGCRICETVCEYDAIEMEDKEEKLVAKISKDLCVGCGLCPSSCPTKAITMQHFTNQQIVAQVQAALKEG